MRYENSESDRRQEQMDALRAEMTDAAIGCVYRVNGGLAEDAMNHAELYFELLEEWTILARETIANRTPRED